jgi:hypothetical protein
MIGCVVTLCVSVALGLPLVTALFVTACVSVALGPAVVPVATPPVGLAVEYPDDVEVLVLVSGV